VILRLLPWFMPVLLVVTGYFAWQTVREAADQPEDRLVRGLLAEPAMLNPILSTGQPDAIVQSHIFEGLIEFNAAMEPQPLLAEAWEQGQLVTFFYGNETRAENALEAWEKAGLNEPEVASLEQVGTELRLRLTRPDSPAARSVFAVLPNDTLLPLVRIEVQQKEAAKASMQHFLERMVNRPAIVRATSHGSRRYQLVAAGEYAEVIEELELYYQANPELEAEIVIEEKEAWLAEPFLRFELRDDVRWHDGEPFDAEDVRFTWQMLVDDAIGSPRRADYEDVVGIDLLGSHEVMIRYGKPFSPALESWSMGMLPEHILNGKARPWWDEHFNRAPIGTGPFRFRRWLAGQRIELARNDHWWRPGPRVAETVFLVIPDQLSLRIAFQSRLLDFLEVDPNHVPTVAKQPGVTLSQAPEPSYTYVGWNLRKIWFRDPRVRRALAHAVNVPGIIDGVLAGQGTQSLGIYPEELWFANRNIVPIEYDPAQAEALLDAAGWPRGSDGIREQGGVRFAFTLITNQGNDMRRDAAALIQADLAKVGIEVEVETYEFAVLVNEKMKKNQFDAYLLGWAGLLGYDQYQIWHSSQTQTDGLNRVGYESEEADELIEALRTTFGRSELKRLAGELQALIYRDQPYLFLYVPEGGFAWREGEWRVRTADGTKREPAMSMMGLELDQPWLEAVDGGANFSAEE